MKRETKSAAPGNDEIRRTEIVAAALECFLKFGYSKTTLDDIAKAAGISRPLLYLKYKNKEDIFKAVFSHVIGDGYNEADKIVKSGKSKKQRLLDLYEILLLRPWEKITGHPMTEDFYVTCDRLFPDVSGQHEKILLKSVAAILADKSVAEILSLAVVGMYADLPPTQELRRRVEVLVGRFA